LHKNNHFIRLTKYHALKISYFFFQFGRYPPLVGSGFPFVVLHAAWARAKAITAFPNAGLPA